MLGDELDGPRGRIYQIKQVLEGAVASASTQLHLDRCLTCMNCETTCPSGVRYGRLLDIGRAVVQPRVRRSRAQRWQRALLLVIPVFAIVARIDLAKHFVSDVAMSALLAALYSLAAATLVRRWLPPPAAGQRR